MAEDPSLAKVDPSNSVQRNIRIPGHLWNRVVDAAEHEGFLTFTAFAHAAFGAKANRAEMEKAAQKIAAEALAADYVAAAKKQQQWS